MHTCTCNCYDIPLWFEVLAHVFFVSLVVVCYTVVLLKKTRRTSLTSFQFVLEACD